MTRKSQQQVAGKVVAVTGGARGIGREIAATLTRAGARVAIGDVDLAAAERTAGELTGDVRAFALDVTDRGSFTAFLDATELAFGSLDVLVNNAGIAQTAPSFCEQDPAAVAATININLLGVLTGTQLAADRMLCHGRGQIVNIASLAGKAGTPGLVAYCASKHGVVGATDALRAEVWGRGLTLTCVMPGPVATGMMDGTTSVRAVQLIEPRDVATAVLHALQTGREEVYVPGNLGCLVRVMSLLSPQARIRAGRLIGAHRIYTEVDATKRADYEARMGTAVPSAAP